MNRQVVAVLAVAALAVATAGFLVGRRSDSGYTPSESSVDVGFARDMAIHHRSAVELAELARDRTDDVDIRRLAADIVLTQQAQAGQMRGWLDAWGLAPTRPGPAMEWMGHPTPASAMPGMPTPSDVDALATATGLEAERSFLELMIEHHQGGIIMAETAAASAAEDEVRALARSIASSQTAEVETLTALLEERAGLSRSSHDD